MIQEDTAQKTALRRRVARDLLRIGAVRLAPEEPFTWSSGLRAPIYCDNRLALAHPDVRSRIAGGFAELVREHDLQPDLVAGTATAGIPHAAWLSDRLDLPMAYVRSEAKEHGRGRRVEGEPRSEQRAVLVEDLVSTGGSALDAAQGLQKENVDVRAVLAIFSYGLNESEERFADASFPLLTLTDFEALLDTARDTGALDDDALASLRRWRDDPQGWSEKA